ncbi:MAG: S8 family serine peptidase [Casimicrobiaceae bacterium]
MSPGRRTTSRRIAIALLSSFVALTAAAATIDPFVAQSLAGGEELEFFVVLNSRADLDVAIDSAEPSAEPSARVKRITAVRDALRNHAARTQAPLREWLDRRGIAYQSFHIVNALLVRADERLMRTLSKRHDVARIEGNPRINVLLPTPEQKSAIVLKTLAAVESGITATNAPALWALGFTGQGIVVGGQDTGVAWNHAALKNQYLGWNGVSANHNYHWHDSIHAQVNPNSPSNPCGYNSATPCDDSSHGTHTMGTAVGDDGAGNQIGMAPGARWIACRNMDQGWGHPSSYLECFEWFLAPYPVGGTSAQGDPSRAPHVTINSWGCPPAEGCTALDILQQAVEAQRAAGIMTVVAAGNSGPSCNTIDDLPAIYDASYSIAAYSSSTGSLASFSSRGLVSIDGSGRQKPDLAAPGVNVRSSIPGGFAAFSGTSMATPHVVGAIALLWSALPKLKGDIAQTEAMLNGGAQAVSLTTAQCGTSGVPNALWGFGKLDVMGAYGAGSLLAVTLAGSGSGSVTSSPAGIVCGATCSAQFSPAAQVTLTATPDPGSIFTGWLGACTGTQACVTTSATASTAVATFGPASLAPLRIDIDVNGQYDALTDGLMILRYLLGQDAASIVEGTIGARATMFTPAGIFARLQDLRPVFDVDGNGEADAFSDGLILIRYLFGLRGPALTAGILGPGATRTAAQIESYISLIRP